MGGAIALRAGEERMEWRQIAEDWDTFVHTVGTRWPRAKVAELLAIGGDREQFEAYISATHDLTPAEVRDDVDALLNEIPTELAPAGIPRDN